MRAPPDIWLAQLLRKRLLPQLRRLQLLARLESRRALGLLPGLTTLPQPVAALAASSLKAALLSAALEAALLMLQVLLAVQEPVQLAVVLVVLAEYRRRCRHGPRT